MNNGKNKEKNTRNYLTLNPEIEKYQMDKMISLGYKFDEDFNLIGTKGKKILATKNGYVYVRVLIDNVLKNIYAHRFSYYYHKGNIPNFTINHIDGNRLNNNPNNLEDIPLYENSGKSNKIKDGIFETKSGDFKLYEKGKVVYTSNRYTECLHIKLLKGLFNRQREEDILEGIQKCKNLSEINKYVESTIFE